MQPIPFADLYVSGDLYRRAMANYDRMEEANYQPAQVFSAAGYSWPGDMEGRTILALALLARATHRPPRYLDSILTTLRGRLNERGYLGPILPAGEFDEQQFSGHNWLLRGLCEVYLWRGEPWVRKTLRGIVEQLFLPARGAYRAYPVDPAQRKREGEAIGELTGQSLGGWRTSSDIGCAFIPLDALTQAHGILRDSPLAAPLAALIDEMIAVYAGIDLLGLSFQTHATLSTLRGVLRWYESTGRSDLLALARRVYGLYRTQGMTENYANHNWFGRPFWTEPCAVIDSYIVATGLWRHTGEPAYLEDAHLIYYNGLGYGQRPNGGYGCDVCLGAEDEFLAPKEGVFEAYWCCTMRGGEGLARAVESLYLLDPAGATLPFYAPSTAHLAWEDGELLLVQRTGYPYLGTVALEVLRATGDAPRRLRLFVPSWAPADALTLTLNGASVAAAPRDGLLTVERAFAAGDRLELSWPVAPFAAPTINAHTAAGWHSFRHGPLLLGLRGQGEPVAIGRDATLEPLGRGRYRVAGQPWLLEPINDLIDQTTEEALADRRQVLFRD